MVSLKKKKKELDERMCALVTKVGEEVFASRMANDCFCRNTPHRHPIVAEEIVKFIEDAVEEAVTDVRALKDVLKDLKVGVA